MRLPKFAAQLDQAKGVKPLLSRSIGAPSSISNATMVGLSNCSATFRAAPGLAMGSFSVTPASSKAFTVSPLPDSMANAMGDVPSAFVCRSCAPRAMSQATTSAWP